MPIRIAFARAIAMIFVSFCAGRAYGQSPLSDIVDFELREWTVPWRAPATGGAPWSDGRGHVWVAGGAEDYVAIFDTTTKTFRRLSVPVGFQPQSIAGNTLAMYVTGTGRNDVLRIRVADDSITAFRIPGTREPEPHSVVFDSVAGAVWFTSLQSGTIGRFNPITRAFFSWHLPDSAQPQAVTLDTHGRPWFTLSGSGSLSTIDSAGRTSQRIALAVDAEPWRLAAAEDGAVWYTDHRRGTLGRVGPATHAIEEFALPGGALSKPSSLTIDARGRLWVAQDGAAANALYVFDTIRRMWIGALVVGRSGSIAISELQYDRATNSIWYRRDGDILGHIALKVPAQPS